MGELTDTERMELEEAVDVASSDAIVTEQHLLEAMAEVRRLRTGIRAAIQRMHDYPDDYYDADLQALLDGA